MSIREIIDNKNWVCVANVLKLHVRIHSAQSVIHLYRNVTVELLWWKYMLSVVEKQCYELGDTYAQKRAFALSMNLS